MITFCLVILISTFSFEKLQENNPLIFYFTQLDQSFENPALFRLNGAARFAVVGVSNIPLI
jgi:hypothetical protein